MKMSPSLLLLGLSGLLCIPALGAAQSAFASIFERSEQPYRHERSLSWKQLQQMHQTATSEGQQLLDLEIWPSDAYPQYWASWGPSTSLTEISAAADWEALKKEENTRRQNGFTLIDLEVQPDSKNGHRYVCIWAKRQQDFKILHAKNIDHFRGQQQIIQERGFYLADAETILQPLSEFTHFSVFQQGLPDEKSYLVLRPDVNTFRKELMQRAQSGFQLLDFEYTAQGQYLGIFKKSNQEQRIALPLERYSYAALLNNLDDNWQIADVELSPLPGARRAPVIDTSRLQRPTVAVSNFLRTANQDAPAGNSEGLISSSGTDLVLTQLRSTDSTSSSRKQKVTQQTIDVVNSLKKYLETRQSPVQRVDWYSIFDNSRIREGFADLEMDQVVLRAKEAPVTLRNSLLGPSVVLLKFGKYAKDSTRLIRKHSYWTTLRGYGLDADGQADPDVFIIADPEEQDLQYQELDELAHYFLLQNKQQQIYTAGQQFATALDNNDLLTWKRQGEVRNKGPFLILEHLIVLRLPDIDNLEALLKR